MISTSSDSKLVSASPVPFNIVTKVEENPEAGPSSLPMSQICEGGQTTADDRNSIWKTSWQAGEMKWFNKV